MQCYSFKQQCELSDSKLKSQPINHVSVFHSVEYFNDFNALFQIENVLVKQLSNSDEIDWHKGENDDEYQSEKSLSPAYYDNPQDNSDAFLCPYCLHKFDGTKICLYKTETDLIM